MTWNQFLGHGAHQSDAHVVMEANEPAFILATSGTTAKPKLAIHTHGGYQVHVFSMGRWCFGLKPSDVWWATSDIGWIVGHSYMVYGPLLTGCTTVVFEGAIDYHTPTRTGAPLSKSSARPAFSPRPRPCGRSCGTATRR